MVASLLWNPVVQASVAHKGYRISDWAVLLPGGAALLTDDDVLVVADLHLGCEAALEDEGLSLPRVQTKKLTNYMESLITEFKPSKVVVAGDMKHNFSRNLAQEWQDVDRFIEVLRGLAPLEVVKGNHDIYLGQILRRHGTRLQPLEARQGRVRIVHGHKGSKTDGPTLMGHIHPSIRLMDDVGASLKDQCFLYNPEIDLLILPALSIVAPRHPEPNGCRYGVAALLGHRSVRLHPHSLLEGRGPGVPHRRGTEAG
jgi:putative SbcD/Mre11-related phosphoesterase